MAQIPEVPRREVRRVDYANLRIYLICEELNPRPARLDSRRPDLEINLGSRGCQDFFRVNEIKFELAFNLQKW